MKTAKKLYRSKTDRIIAGVCGGLGEYWQIDPTIIRIIFVALALFNGLGLILYVIMALVVPVKGGSGIEGNASELVEQSKKLLKRHRRSDNGRHIFGIIIIIIGGLLLLQNFMPNGWWLATGHMLWPWLIVIIGLYILLNNKE